MTKDLETDLMNLLDRHAISDVLAGIAEIMQQPGGDSALMERVGKIIEDLTACEFWD